MANLKEFDKKNGLEALAAVERESFRSSRNVGNLKFSPKLDRPSNPLGKLLDREYDEIELPCKNREKIEESYSLVSTLASTKD